MSYNDGQSIELSRGKRNNNKMVTYYTYKKLKEEVRLLKQTLYTLEVAIAEMGKELNALRRLVTNLKIVQVESITGGIKNEEEKMDSERSSVLRY